MHEEKGDKYEEPCRADECLDIPEVEKRRTGESPGKDEEEHEELVEELLEEAKHEFQCVVELRQVELEHETTQHVSNKEFSDVLVIITGGTLTMVATDKGY